jgi:hypothetical protein
MAAASCRRVPFFVGAAGAIPRRQDTMPVGDHGRWHAAGTAMSGSALAVTTGLAAGVVLLGTAVAGFHDLAGLRPAGRGPAGLSAKAR